MKESGMKIEKVKRYTMAKSTCKQRIVLDMSYDHLMSDKVITLQCVGISFLLLFILIHLFFNMFKKSQIHSNLFIFLTI